LLLSKAKKKTIVKVLQAFSRNTKRGEHVADRMPSILFDIFLTGPIAYLRYQLFGWNPPITAWAIVGVSEG